MRRGAANVVSRLRLTGALGLVNPGRNLTAGSAVGVRRKASMRTFILQMQRLKIRQLASDVNGEVGVRGDVVMEAMSLALESCRGHESC